MNVGGEKVSRFAKIYVSVFSVIWIGYGCYSLIMKQPHSLTLLLFGTSFAIVFFFATWFSQWLIGNYKRVDAFSKSFFSKKVASRKQN
jgi:hypothetical protein